MIPDTELDPIKARSAGLPRKNRQTFPFLLTLLESRLSSLSWIRRSGRRRRRKRRRRKKEGRDDWIARGTKEKNIRNKSEFK